MCALGALLLLLAEPAPAQTSTLTVDGADPACDDSTGAPAYCTIQAAVDAATPGSIINVAPATYAERVTIRTEGLRLRGDPGDTANRAADTFFGPGPNAPILDGSSLSSSPISGDNSAIRVVAPATSVIIEGFEIRSYSGFRASGVEAWETVTNVSNVVISDNYIHNMQWNCVLVGSVGTTTHSNIQVSRNRCENYGGYGLELTNSDLSELRDNEVLIDGFAGILAGAQNVSGNVTVSALSIAGNVLSASGATPPDGIAVYAWGRNGSTALTTQTRVTGNAITTSSTAIVGYAPENGSISVLRADTNTITINNPNTVAARLTAARCASLPEELLAHAPTCAAQTFLAADADSAIDALSVAESVTIDANRIELTGTPGEGAYHAIRVSGADTASVTIAQNTLLGNAIGTDTNGVLLTSDLPANANIAINQNIFRGFARSIFSNTAASPSATGNLLSDVLTLALAHTTTSAFDAQGNWWGCNAGPGNAGCTTFFGTTVDVSDPLQLSLISDSPIDSVETNSQLTLRARVINNQGDVLVDGIAITFAIIAGNALGSIDPPTDTTSSGTATTTLSTGAQIGPMTIAATLDNQTVTLTITVTSGPVPGPPTLFLPIVANADPAPTPSFVDVVVSDIRLTPDKTVFAAGEAVEVAVTITNQGAQPTSLFWIDMHVNPSQPPGVNLVWDQNCGLFPCQGLAWRIAQPLAPGESLTLTSNPADPLIDTNASIWYGFFFNGTTELAVFADSWNPGVPTGALTEGEDSNAPGEQNNTLRLSGLSVTGVNPPADVQPPVSPR